MLTIVKKRNSSKKTELTRMTALAKNKQFFSLLAIKWLRTEERDLLAKHPLEPIIIKCYMLLLGYGSSSESVRVARKDTRG